MKERRIISSLRLNMVIVILTTFALLNVFYKFVNVNNMFTDNYLDTYLTYTYLSSFLVGFSSLLMFFFEFRAIRKNKDVPAFIDGLKYVATCGIILTFVVTYGLLLPRSYETSKLDIIFSIDGPLYVHTLIPLLCIISCLFTEPFNRLKKCSVLFATLPPLMYLGYALINKYFFDTESYYFFLKFEGDELIKNIIYTASIGVGYILIAIILLVIKNKIFRSSNRGVRSKKDLDLNVGKNDKIVQVSQYRESGLKPVEHKEIKVEEKVLNEEERKEQEKKSQENLDYIKAYGLQNAMSSLANKPVEQKLPGDEKSVEGEVESKGEEKLEEKVEQQSAFEEEAKPEDLEDNIIRETIDKIVEDEISTKEDLSVSDTSGAEELDEEEIKFSSPIEINLEESTPKRRVNVSSETKSTTSKPKTTTKSTLSKSTSPAKKTTTKSTTSSTSKPKKPVAAIRPKTTSTTSKPTKPVSITKKKEETTPDNDYKGKERVYHISKQKSGKWQVKLANGEKPIKLFFTQKEAIEFTKDLVDSQGGSYRIHSLQGKIRKDS